MNINDNKLASNLRIKPLAFAVACAISGQVLAAEEQAAVTEDHSKGVERISVTAQKRVSTLQETPIAITAFNAESLENRGIENISDVNSLSPNLQVFAPIGSAFNVGMNIRGLGTAEPSLAIDPKVGIYLDGVYLARNAGAIFNIVDLERMEVLRGPQGTLWGKNTTGGALNLVTTKPSDDFEFKQKFTVGSNNEFNSTTSIDTGALGNLTARLTYMTGGHDGWATNTFEGAKEKDLGAEDVDAMRIALRYAGETFTVDYSYDNTDGSSVSIPVQISNVRPQFTNASVTQNMGNGKIYAGNVFAMMAANEHDSSRQTEFELDNQGREYVDIEGHNLTVEWDFSDNHTLKSITSYRSYDSDLTEGADSDGGAYFAPALDFSTSPPSVDMSDVIAIPAFHYSGTKSQDQTSQEFQLLGEFLEGDLKYVAGLYYFTEEGEEDNPWSISLPASANANILFTDPLPWGSFYSVTADSTALFFNVDYKLTDELNVVAGIRYTEDERSLTQLAANDPMLRENLTAKEDWSKTVGSLLFNYVFDQNLTVYTSISQGYAAGVYNPGAVERFAYLDPANQGQANYEGSLTPADPEDTTAYEFGVKAMLFEDRLMLNSAVFLNDNTNLQKTVIGQDRVRRSINTGKSKSIGFEVDANFAATDNLFFTASFGYIDTDYSEDDISDTSNYSASLAMSWTIAELDFGDLTLHTDYVMVDEFQYNLTDPSLVGDSYELLNARLTLSDIQVGDRSSLKVSLWGKNIADEDYVVHGANFGMYDAQTYGAPATYGVDVSFEF